MEEFWKDIKGYEGFYQLSNFGNIKSVNRCIIRSNGRKQTFKGIKLSPSMSKIGYYVIALQKKGYIKRHYIHRLLAQTFIQNIDNKPYINHINGIKSDNRLENLEWCTHFENMLHSRLIGLNMVIGQKGENHSQSKLTNNQVLEIKNKLKSGARGFELAKEYNVSQSTICGIKNKRTHI